jgi:hypothetical protein
MVDGTVIVVMYRTEREWRYPKEKRFVSVGKIL